MPWPVLALVIGYPASMCTRSHLVRTIVADKSLDVLRRSARQIAVSMQTSVWSACDA